MDLKKTWRDYKLYIIGAGIAAVFYTANNIEKFMSQEEMRQLIHDKQVELNIKAQKYIDSHGMDGLPSVTQKDANDIALLKTQYFKRFNIEWSPP